MSGEERNIAFELKNVSKEFPVQGRKDATVKALKNVSLTVYRGESFGVVGESGCGKSTLVKTVLGLYQPTRGQVLYDGHDINARNKAAARQLHDEVQVVFQDPFSSLSPRMRIWEIIAEPLIIRGKTSKRELVPRVEELLELIGLPASAAMKYPHQFSGGQRQRIAIARALSVMPKCIVLDEPVSALDASVRAQVLNLLKDLQDKFHLTYIMISHDLEVMEHVCDRIGVMYLGQLMELAPCRELFAQPMHPYTKRLLDSILTIDPDAPKKKVQIEDIPSPIEVRPGCPFYTRCAEHSDVCKEEPHLVEVHTGHFVACPHVTAANN